MAPYDLDQHRHRFAVWAAARAAQRGFTSVTLLRDALEGCGVVEFVSTADLAKFAPDDFDSVHRTWCTRVVEALNGASISNVTFGRAAKLVAVYLKSAVILGAGSNTAFAHVAHPPIDSILLRNLVACPKVQSEYKPLWRRIKWTKLDEAAYYDLVPQIRQVVGTEVPFWKLERYWTLTNEPQE